MIVVNDIAPADVGLADRTFVLLPAHNLSDVVLTNPVLREMTCGVIASMTPNSFTISRLGVVSKAIFVEPRLAGTTLFSPVIVSERSNAIGATLEIRFRFNSCSQPLPVSIAKTFGVMRAFTTAMAALSCAAGFPLRGTKLLFRGLQPNGLSHPHATDIL